MRKFLVLLFSCVSFSLCAQVGRFEEPVDTIPIGGQTQENKETQMQSQDQLAKELISVRDSIQFLPGPGDHAARRKELDRIVEGLQSRDQAPDLMKKGFAMLNEIRTQLRAEAHSKAGNPRKTGRR